jgi:hypothetical protein
MKTFCTLCGCHIHHDNPNDAAVDMDLHRQFNHPHSKEEEMLNLIVKGTAKEARKAAHDRAIPFSLVRELEHETIGRTRSRYRANVDQWFGQQTKAPFPVGTLLHFSEAAGVGYRTNFF